MNVAVLGASDDPERYSYKAVRLLREKGHEVYPVHPKLKEVQGIAVRASVADIREKIDTITLYLSPEVSTKLADQIVAAKPRRLIFNPGAENPLLAQKAEKEGIQVLDACTLVLLTTNQF